MDPVRLTHAQGVLQPTSQLEGDLGQNPGSGEVLANHRHRFLNEFRNGFRGCEFLGYRNFALTRLDPIVYGHTIPRDRSADFSASRQQARALPIDPICNPSSRATSS